MHFGLSEEQQLIVDTTRAFVENELYPHELEVERTGHLRHELIEEINSVESRFGPDIETLLVIGHEPTMSSLALGLATAEGSNSAAAERISTKFPTSAIAVLRTGEPWDQLTLSGAALVGFHVPR